MVINFGRQQIGCQTDKINFQKAIIPFPTKLVTITTFTPHEKWHIPPVQEPQIMCTRNKAKTRHNISKGPTAPVRNEKKPHKYGQTQTRKKCPHSKDNTKDQTQIWTDKNKTSVHTTSSIQTCMPH